MTTKCDLNYRRRRAWEVKVGCTAIGGENPVRLQSMTSTSTMDTPGSVAQALRIAEAGGELVRLTAQGVREAANLEAIRAGVRAAGCDVPLVADIHFNPRAALEAALHVEKVRINPGNFVDPGRVFKKIDYTDSEYAAELARIEEGLLPLLAICREKGTALRIGVNHGSLSDRIMSRYGDTPAGMVESAMEFLRVCLKHDFRDVVISVKASNVAVMTETMRRLAAAMEAEDMHFPLHLGVTEAGDGEDGRIKSAVGIGSLLADGIGDTIRVSLSEDPELEIPEARRIADHVARMAGETAIPEVTLPEGYDICAPQRRIAGGSFPVVGLDMDPGEIRLEVVAEEALPDEDLLATLAAMPGSWISVTSRSLNPIGWIKAFMFRLMERGIGNPVVISLDYSGLSAEDTVIAAAVDLGAILLAGFGDGVRITSDAMEADALHRLALNILQATRLRISKTEFIACPGCGRTLYDLQSTLRAVKEATGHLKGLKIGVMGCIVNGPGEMADADYGYVGAAVGKISLYKGKECVEKNIPASEAIEHLIDLIKTGGDWQDREE